MFGRTPAWESEGRDMQLIEQNLSHYQQSRWCRSIASIKMGQMTAKLPNPQTEGVTAEFGYYPVSWSVNTNQFSIQALPDHQRIVAEITNNPNISKDWIYPGAQRKIDFISGEKHLMPYNSRVFGLPKTHVVTLHKSNNREDLEFVVWCLSFFTGMRLTTTDAGFLDATPVKPGKLVDFILSQRSLPDAVQMALDYLTAECADPRAPRRVTAVIHALFLAQYPQNLCFEQFNYLYMALDACFSLLLAKEAGRPHVKHAERIQWMCGKFNMQVPDWADCSATGKSGLSCVRNDTFHEALFFSEPLGFSVYGGNRPGADPHNVTLQMQALICRLLVAILGSPGSSYVRTPVDTRQIHGLEL